MKTNIIKLTISCLFCTLLSFASNGQAKTEAAFPFVTSFDLSYGLTYCEGIEWTEKKYPDRTVDKIIILGDTMTAVRNLLEYLLEEKAENDRAKLLLSHINLDFINKFIPGKTFPTILKEYRETVFVNENNRAIKRQKNEYQSRRLHYMNALKPSNK